MTAREALKVGAPFRCHRCAAMVREVPMVSGPAALVDSKPRRMVVLHAQPTLFGDPDVVGSVGHAYEPHVCRETR